jgi:hypothetical protein
MVGVDTLRSKTKQEEREGAPAVAAGPPERPTLKRDAS